MSHPSPVMFAVLSILLVIGWSSGFVGIRFATDAAPVGAVLFWRSAISGLVLLPFALLWGPRITAQAVREQAVFAGLGMFIYLGGFALAIGRGVPTGLVALMADLVPIAIAVLSGPLLGQSLTARQWLGSAVAVAGVLVVSAEAAALGDAPPWAYLLPVAAMLSFALATVWQERRGGVNLAIQQRLCLQCLWAALMFAPCAALWGGIAPPLTAQFALGIGWLVLLATLLAWSVYFMMLRLFTPARVAAVIYLSPPVTMIWAWALFDEPLTVTLFAGLAVSLVGVALVAGRVRQEKRA